MYHIRKEVEPQISENPNAISEDFGQFQNSSDELLVASWRYPEGQRKPKYLNNYTIGIFLD